MNTKIQSFRLLFRLIALLALLIFSSDAYSIQIVNEQKQNCKRVQDECLNKMKASRDFGSCLEKGPPGCAEYSFEMMKEFETHLKRVEAACKTERKTFYTVQKYDRPCYS